MELTIPQVAVALIGFLHLLFMIFELYPWSSPKLMNMVLGEWPQPLDLSNNDKHLVSMVVHNAGIYNGIVAAALFATAFVSREAYPVQVVLLSGGVVAGFFGAATLNKKTVGQAILGIIALAVVVWFRGA